MPLRRKIRVLGLHGAGDNTNIMQHQTSYLRRMLGDAAEWDFLPGTHPWEWRAGERPSAFLRGIADGMPFAGWFRAPPEVDVPPVSYWASEEADPNHPAFRIPDEHLRAAVGSILRHLRQAGPFDVLVAFSQGCAISHVVAGLLRERGEAVPWRLSLLFCGLGVRDPALTPLFQPPLESPPALMVFGGRKDLFYEYGLRMQVPLYADPIVLEHDEGHKFPSKSPGAQLIYDRCVQEILQHCGQA